MSISTTVSLCCDEDIDQFDLEASQQPSEDEEAKKDIFINDGDPEEDSNFKTDLRP